MKTFGTLLSEILDSTQKKDVDKWEKGDNSFSNSLFDKPEHDSITIPLQHPGVEGHSEEIQKHLEPHGFKIKDYKAGLATDKHGRDTKIGKALGATKAPEELKNKFANDPARSLKAKTDNLRVTITKNPYHVAGMTSKGQCWEQESCMNFTDGDYNHFLKDDLKHGTHVAYLHDKDDVDLEHPHARIALKKFTSEDGTHSILGAEHKTYGPANDAFTHTVNQHLEERLPPKEDKIYHKHKSVYDDDERNLKFHPSMVKSLVDNPNHGMHPIALTKELFHHKLTPDQIDKFRKHPQMETMMRHPGATHDQLSDWLDKHIKNTKDSSPAVLGNPNLSADHLDTIVKSGLSDIHKRSAIRDSKNTQPRHIKYLLDNMNFLGDDMAITHKAMNKDIMDEHVKDILSGKHDHVAHGYLQHSKFLTPDHVHALTDHYLATNPMKENNRADTNMNVLAGSKHITDEDYNRIKEHKTIEGKTDLGFLKTNIANKNPRITSDDIHSAIDQSKGGKWSYGLRALVSHDGDNIAAHPNFNEEHEAKLNQIPDYRTLVNTGRK